jgi:hypothetical protein
MSDEEIFDQILSVLASSAEGHEELIRIWINLGKRLGVCVFLPYIRVVVYEDEEKERHLISIVASPSEEVADELASSERISDEMIISAIKSIVEIYGEPH